LVFKPSSFPIDPIQWLHNDDTEEYWAFVGKSLYLTSIRPYITFLVQQVSQFLDSPTSGSTQRSEVLKGNLGTSLFFSRRSSLDLLGFSDVGVGLVSQILGGSSQDIASSLAKHWFVGNQRSN